MKKKKFELAFRLLVFILCVIYFLIRILNLADINTPITALQFSDVLTPVLFVYIVY